MFFWPGESQAARRGAKRSRDRRAAGRPEGPPPVASSPRCLQSRSLPPRAVPATGFRRAPLVTRRKCWPQPLAAAELTLQRRAMLTHALPVLTATALRHLHRAHAACIAAPHTACRCNALSQCSGSTRQRYAPCSRFSRSGFRRLRAGHLFELTPALKGASKVRAVLASSRYAASVRCGRRIFLVPSFASPGEVHPKVHCQRSSRRTGQRGLTAGLPPPRAGLPAAFTPPVGQRNEPSLRFGLLALAPSALYR